MALHRLDNAAWGFESSCFVCEPSNPSGLGIPFFHDDDAGVVRAEFCLGAAFSGAPTYVHGGITLAILDEAMAWATIALGRSFALTRTTATEFLRPVRVDRRHRVEARIVSRSAEVVEAEGLVADSDGGLCARSTSSFDVMTHEAARSATGSVVAGDDAAYLRA